MKLLFWGCKGYGFFSGTITRAAHRLKLLEMQFASSNIHISSQINFWYLRGMGYCLHVNGCPVVDISILNTLVLPVSVKICILYYQIHFPARRKIYP